jgi:hypothetical protein
MTPHLGTASFFYISVRVEVLAGPEVALLDPVENLLSNKTHVRLNPYVGYESTLHIAINRLHINLE